jgi:predicted GNAT family N-acyltransferase
MKTGEEKHVYKLTRSVFDKDVAPTYSKKGIKTFLSMLSLEFLKEASNEKFTVVAEYQERIVGILAIISISHVALLFVDSKFQRQGVGNKLIHYAINKCLERQPDLKSITVSATPNSVQFYKNDGFMVIGSEICEDGMRFIPMQKNITIND